MAIRELQSKEFIGGAAIVAQHIRSMGANCHYCSVVGEDAAANFVKESLTQSGIKTYLYEDEGRPTTYKIRYIVENQKLLRVSRLKQHAINTVIENKLIEQITEIIPKVDGVIISDFVYGVVTPKILQITMSKFLVIFNAVVSQEMWENLKISS